MADIKMIKYHALPMARARQLVQKAADDLGDEYDLTSEWHGDTLRFHRSGVEGQMKVTAAEIHLDVTLGFLLKMMRGSIEQAVGEELDKLFAEHKKVAEKEPSPKAEPAATAKKPAARKKSSP